MAEKLLLAGDVGGTKILLALYEAPAGGDPRLIKQDQYPSADFGGLDAALDRFLGAAHAGRVAAAAFGLAGPVVAGRCDLRKLGWVIEEKKLAARFGFGRCALLNDLLALAWGVSVLDPSSCHIINAGEAGARGNAGLVAPGTGLGEAILFHEGGRWMPSSSEGGLADFAPADEDQVELLRYVMKKHQWHSVERVVSGPGLANIYDFLRDTGRAAEPEWLAARIKASDDPNAAIGQCALERSSELCIAALDLFVRLLAGESGNMAMRVLAWGGLYLGGGIPPKILPFLTAERFMPAFTARERYGAMLERVPVRVILEARTGLFGAAHYAALMLRGER